ncbi:MAG TPA: UDP-N-acetylglucosamine--N-acetylmuramyl-(pentapeptide) pyrophosphoryl-undecaprenol N-acetylglucosamine transferase [Patescibacteria group bacterium]|nr:UDP-N-acetylglucosamine--N-acetylmuramyl-(pentapeptide) pyrophosphoryl-undecaprenol N-acetylglucosamine transferase [Patescibacteria group bacterium]
MQKKNDILITGGHAATTAIPVIEKLQKEYSGYNLFWVGPKSAVEGKFVPTLASEVMPKLGVKFIPITTGRLQRKFTIWTIPSLLKIPIGILQSFKILFDIKPKIILSFGGYASVPVCFAGFVLGIPVFVHEQTVAVGLANKISSSFAKKIFIAREESKQSLHDCLGKKIFLVGNPISSEILKIPAKTKISKSPTLYITGGSSGAQRINNAVSEILYELLKNYKVIHQTGKLDYQKFENLKNEFPTDLKKNYEVYAFLDPKNVSNIFEKSDLIISRAGANTISEIAITGRPAIIIPIPWTSYNEQFKNAQMLEKSGQAIVLEEKYLTGQNLLNKINLVIKNWKSMANKKSEIAELDKKAAGKIVQEIEEYLK